MRHVHLIPIAATVGLLVAACDTPTGNPTPAHGGSVFTEPPPVESAPAPAEAPPLVAPSRTPDSGYIAHEWGTFTSVQDSDGNTLVGLHHEDEPLPEFVRRRPLRGLGWGVSPKHVEKLPGHVTQKLETPVIYFHTHTAMNVSVDVDFPKGILSEWYPAEKRILPDHHTDFDGVANSSLGWDVALLPNAGRDDLPQVHDDDIWAPSRNVDCAKVRVDSDNEMFIFYRGLADFVLPIRVTHGADGLLRVSNTSDDDIPDVVLLDNDGLHGGVVHIGSVAAGATVTVPVVDRTRPVNEYVDLAREVLQVALEADGLYGDEALAMVDTWTQSYFHTPGLRALYVVPKAWTEELLPIRLDPEPVELVRTMVGRIEILTRDFEAKARDLVNQLYAQREALDTAMSKDMGGSYYPLYTMSVLEDHFGRFAEPRVRRAAQQLPPGDIRDFALEVVDYLDARITSGLWD